VSAPRLATIPFEHIEAELAAFPFVSEASFRFSTTSLNPMVNSRDNDKLWRTAERDVLTALPSVPHDEVAVIRDKLWFNSANPDQNFSPVPLVKYLRRLSESYLDKHGQPAEIALSDANTREHARPEARLRWSWMCRALPPDFLRVARGVIDADGNPFPLSPVIQQVLCDQGFAETHLHIGAALDFSIAWAALMRHLTTNESKHSEFESPGAYFKHGRDFSSWILHAAVARLILAQWLFNNPSSKSSFKASLNELLAFACKRLNSRLNVVENSRLATTLSELRRGGWFEPERTRYETKREEHYAKRFAQTRALYLRLVGSPNLIRNRETERQALRRLYEPESRLDVFANDPLARIVGWHPTEVNSPETLFVAAALRYIEQDKDGDSDFARLFWQVIRIRCLLYRHVVQRPLTPGLQWFVRFFSRIKPLRRIPKRVLMSTAAHICGKDAGLRSLEVRLGTEESVSHCLEMIRDLETATHLHGKDTGFRFFRSSSNNEKKDRRFRLFQLSSDNEKNDVTKLEVGALFHFSRKRGGGWERGSLNAYGLDYSYPGIPLRLKRLKDAGNPTGFRFARFYLEQRRHAQALVSVFRMYPLALRTVRGVDLCTDEAGVPVWVMAPLVRWVREAGQQAAIQLRHRGEFNIPPLRASIHAGEDFVHLLTGLRRLDEAVTYLRLEEGDRLGHALALGIDPSVWCGRVGRVIQTREERLFDLVWEWSCYAKHGIGVASERLAYVRTETVRLARAIFDQSCSPEDLMNFVDLLHDEQALHAQGFPARPPLRNWDLDEQKIQNNEIRDELEVKGRHLLKAYLRDETVWRKGRIPETVDLRNVRHEQASLNQLQEGLRRKIGKLCLTIEVNPSSNLLIGDLGNFAGHPLWRLRPVIPVDDGASLSVCIGSDDPLTFATTLPQEYQLLFDSLILMGHSHEVALKWIDAARDAGMQSRFTLPPNIKEISKGLKTPTLLGWERPMSPP
jgi:hypothetical protein